MPSRCRMVLRMRGCRKTIATPPRSDTRAARPHTVRSLRRRSGTSLQSPDPASSDVASPPVAASIRPFVFHSRFNLCEQGNCGCGRSEQRRQWPLLATLLPHCCHSIGRRFQEPTRSDERRARDVRRCKKLRSRAWLQSGRIRSTARAVAVSGRSRNSCRKAGS